MKKMIITQEQLQAINEAAITYGGPVANQTPLQLQTKANAAFAKDPKTPGVQFTGTNGNGGSIVGDENTTQQELNNADTVFFQNTNKDNALGESRYTKRQVELGRMLEMRKRGKVYSKKQLNEMFMETRENADRLRDGIGQCDVFEVLDAVEEFFPEESEGFKEALHNGADLAEYLCSIFSRGDINSEEEEEFLNALGI